MIDAQQISKLYLKAGRVITALNAITLHIAPGEFVAIQGPSGCGKTTLLLTIGGLLAPDGGQIIVDSRNPYTLSPDARAAFRAQTIGFVFQQFHLVPYLCVRDNVLAAALARPMADARERTAELLDRFDLAERADHLPADLSTGERQRTALARALMNHPKVLLADEPTGNLDREHAGIVLAYLTDFTRAGGSVLLVTHDDQVAVRSERVIRMARGKFDHEG